MIQYAKTCVHSVHSMDRGLQVFLGHVHVIRLHPSGCATALSHGKRALDTTKLLRVRAKALSCRRSRFRSSFATRTKRPAISAGAGEHSVHVSQGCASDPHKKWGSGLGSRAAPRRHGGTQESMGRAQVWWRRMVCTSSAWQTLRTPLCQQLPVLVVHAAPASAMNSIMMRRCTHCSSSGRPWQKHVFRHCNTRHMHTCNV